MYVTKQTVGAARELEQGDLVSGLLLPDLVGAASLHRHPAKSTAYLPLQPGELRAEAVDQLRALVCLRAENVLVVGNSCDIAGGGALAAQQRGEALELTEDEMAFYDALETNDSAVKVLGDTVLTEIARELTSTIRNSVTIDWTAKETVRAKLRTLVRRTLRRLGYPPDKTEKAVETVIKQAELLAVSWAT